MARDQPYQSYYPGARVRFGIRFEDFGASDVPTTPELPAHLRKGKSGSKGGLEVVEKDGAFLLIAPGDDPSSLGSPQQQRASADGRTFWIEGIIPQRATFKRNGIRTANTLTVELLYRDLPFDPRVIRSAAVQFFLGTVSADEYQRGINGQLRAQATPSGSLPYNAIPDEGPNGSNLRFEGWVDDWEDDWSEADAPTVNVSCTDNTRLLIAQDAPPKLTIGKDKEIDRAVAEYLANFPQFHGLSVTYQPTVDRSEIPKLSTGIGSKFRPTLGPTPSGKLSVWDYITDVCGAVGHIVRFVGTSVVIQRPRTLYDSNLPSRSDDPFVGRKLPSGRVLDRRLFVYGRNVQSLSFKRQFTTFVPNCIEVRCYDTNKKTTVIARFPEKEDRPTHPLPGNASDQKWTVLEVRWPPDPKTLKVIAQNAYEQLGRQELIAQLVTKNLASFGGGNLDPDALACEPGDAIDIETYRGEDAEYSTVTEIEDQIRTRAADFLTSLGFKDRELTQAYQNAVNNIGLQTTFRVKTVAYDWDNEDGIKIDFELFNYVEVRADKDSPEIQITPEDTAANTQLDVVVEDEVQE